MANSPVHQSDERRAAHRGAFLDEAGKVAETPRDWGLSVMFRDFNERLGRRN